MELTEHRAIEYNAAELSDILNRCFEGYMVPFVLTADMFERRFRPEGLDSSASLILMEGEEPAGVCLISRQGWTSRVAAMAIAPHFRSKGLGKRIMTTVIAEAKDRGDKRMVLEAIANNDAAIGLYESVGMRKTRQLIGYRRGPVSACGEILVEIDPAEFVRRQANECSNDLVWDFKPETLTLKVNAKAYSLDGKAFALVTEAPNDRLVIWSIFVNADSRRQGYGRRLVDSLASAHPERMMVFPIAVPDDLAHEFMTAMGFEVPEIKQYELAIDLV